MSEQQKFGKIQKAKKFCNQIEKKINENILFRTLLWGEQNRTFQYQKSCNFYNTSVFLVREELHL
jgi:hypothetical protein